MGSPSNGKGCFMTRFYPRESAGICGSKLNAQFRLQLRHVVPCEPVAALVFFAVLQQLQQVHHLSAAFGGGYRLSRSLAIQRGKRHVEPLSVALGGLPTGEVVAQVAQMLAAEFPQQHLAALQPLTRGAFQRQLAAGNAEMSEYAPPSGGVFGFIQPGILGGVLLAIERLGLVERAAERSEERRVGKECRS